MNISDKIQVAMLIVTLLVAIATFISTYLTYYTINLSARPTLKIEATSISLAPDIAVDNKNILSLDENCRYTINIKLIISNIGSNPAQDISVDGEVFFKNQTPFGYKSLPVHLPQHINILAPKSIDLKDVQTSVNFDNYVAREILIDHFNNHKNGLAMLPYKKEITDRKIWPSPKLRVKCYYSDIQNKYYKSEIDLFFHAYVDTKNSYIKIYLLNMLDLNFAKVRRINRFARDRSLFKIRHKRHISFSGAAYPKDELVTLVIKE